VLLLTHLIKAGSRSRATGTFGLRLGRVRMIGALWIQARAPMPGHGWQAADRRQGFDPHYHCAPSAGPIGLPEHRTAGPEEIRRPPSSGTDDSNSCVMPHEVRVCATPLDALLAVCWPILSLLRKAGLTITMGVLTRRCTSRHGIRDYPFSLSNCLPMEACRVLNSEPLHAILFNYLAFS